jgi:hypothetical protein
MEFNQNEQYENNADLDNNNETWEKELSADDLMAINGGLLAQTLGQIGGGLDTLLTGLGA